jgi:hypothetical protein
LRKLDLEDYTNAVSVLFRVFIELNVDIFIDKHHLSITDNDSLGKKLSQVATFLRSTGKINDQQVRAIQLIAQKGSFLATSITTLHQYVHNPYSSPSPSDLRATWDSIEFLITAIWQ